MSSLSGSPWLNLLRFFRISPLGHSDYRRRLALEVMPRRILIPQVLRQSRRDGSPQMTTPFRMDHDGTTIDLIDLSYVFVFSTIYPSSEAHPRSLGGQRHLLGGEGLGRACGPMKEAFFPPFDVSDLFRSSRSIQSTCDFW